MEKKFNTILVDRLKSENIKVTDFAKRTGIDKETLYSITRRPEGSTNVEMAIEIVKLGFDETIEEFIRKHEEYVSEADKIHSKNVVEKIKSLSDEIELLSANSKEALITLLKNEKMSE